MQIRWKEYFEQLLNAGGEEQPIELQQEPEVAWQVQRAIQQMKNGKSPGIDGLPVELFKSSGEDIIKWIHRLMTKAWNQQTIPAEWERAIENTNL